MAKGRKKKKMALCGCNTSGIGRIERVSGGSVSVHNDREAAKIQGNRADNILELLYNELHEFHNKLERKDMEIETIVSNCYNRNEAQMERIDKLISIIVSQNETIIKQDKKNQERADALMQALENKT